MFRQVLVWLSPAASLCHWPRDGKEITCGNVFSSGRGEWGSTRPGSDLPEAIRCLSTFVVFLPQQATSGVGLGLFIKKTL